MVDNGVPAPPLVQKYLPELIYGSNDGLITTFAIVSGVVGARLSNSVVVILGLASLFADGISMAASDFLSERSDPEEKASRAVAARKGGVTFGGFVLIGAVPLVAYLAPIPDGVRFPLAAVMTLLTLFVVGAGRSAAHEDIHWLKGGIEMADGRRTRRRRRLRDRGAELDHRRRPGSLTATGSGATLVR